MINKPKIIRVTTVPQSLDGLLKGQLKYLNQFYDVIGVASPGERLMNVEKREGIKTISVDIERKISLFKDLKSLYGLFLIFKKEKPVIVHSMTPKAGMLSMIASFFAKVPIRVNTFTGLIFPYKKGLFQLLLILMDRITCKFSTNIFPEGEGVKNDLKKFNITKKKLNIIANGNINGVNLDVFDVNKYSEENKINFRNKYGLKKSDFVYMFIGRLVGDKGVNELIESFNEIENDGSLKLLLIGDFEHKLDPLKDSTIISIKNNKDIVWVGYKKDVVPFLAISDILVFPSYREGFPNVVLQSCAMKLPCIVTDISGSNEIITEGVNGWVIPSKSKKHLLDKMIFVKENKELLYDIGEKNLKLIEEKFAQKIVWEAIKVEYDSLLEGVKM